MIRWLFANMFRVIDDAMADAESLDLMPLNLMMDPPSGGPIPIKVDAAPEWAPDTPGPHWYTFKALPGTIFGDSRYKFEIWGHGPTYLGVWDIQKTKGELRSPRSGAVNVHAGEASLKGGDYLVGVWPKGGAIGTQMPRYGLKVSKKKGWFG